MLIEVLHFKMKNLNTFKSILNPADFMVSLNLTDAFLTVPIRQDSRKFLRFVWRQKHYQFNPMTFGLNVAPRMFTKLLKPAVACLRGQGIRLIVYLDDLLDCDRSTRLARFPDKLSEVTTHPTTEDSLPWP